MRGIDANDMYKRLGGVAPPRTLTLHMSICEGVCLANSEVKAFTRISACKLSLCVRVYEPTQLSRTLLAQMSYSPLVAASRDIGVNRVPRRKAI